VGITGEKLVTDQEHQDAFDRTLDKYRALHERLERLLAGEVADLELKDRVAKEDVRRLD
jgi:hypothetical protein